MGKRDATMLFMVVLYLRICFAASLNRSSTDESSLLALKGHLNSEIMARNWSQQTSFCSWIGVTCSRRHPRVTSLDLSNMGVRGTVAREIGNLSFLTFLDISNNSINGLIPAEIGKLRRLRVLDMASNHLTDRIPSSLGLLRKLERLYLGNNYLTGDIPTSLSACVQLNVLDLSYNNLTGNIPSVFGNLSQLQLLSLRTNQLTGELPATIFNISSMRSVFVAQNQLSGSMPKDICSHPTTNLEHLGIFSNQFRGEILSSLTRCHSLKQLAIWSNKFTENIPSEFWNLSALQRVALSRNGFTGTIPASIVNMSNLELFDISENIFHGTVPSEIGQLSRLTWLNLQVNKLNGEVPQSIFNLSRLQSLSLTSNNLSGYLPFSVGKGLQNIEYLILGVNHFHGEIPDSLSNLSRLVTLDLSDNSFTGHIPITLGNLHQLQRLSLGGNQLKNNISKPEQDFLSSLTACNHLKLIEVSANPITGVLPKSLGSSNLSASLETFHAHSCRIISPIPNEIGNLSNLLLLNLAYNDLRGEVPATLGLLSNLQRLALSGNKWQGSISVLCNLKNLYYINLEENYLFGELPSCLGNLSMLRDITLSDNAFNSSIPTTFWLNERLERAYLSNNFLHGPLHREIGNLKSLRELDLSGNKIFGEIPSTISQLQNLITLSLSDNRFSGNIVESFADLKDLQYLDLSNNNFSGPIPKSLEALAYLRYFNVSFNELSGEIPDRGPFLNFTADSFTGNNGLCGAPQFKVEACRRSMPTSTRKEKLLKVIIPTIASVVVVVVVVVLVLVFRCRGRKLSPSSLHDSPLGIMHERISYYEVLRATNNLDEENLIGRGSFGSVYKGSFSDATVVAVKVFDLDVQGALTSFDTECQIIGGIRHRNLVKIITSCSNLDFKALLMAYMPNGDLENLLYHTRFLINFSQRLGIMTDVASALEYLHEGHTFPIVHCDLKPSNILLDEEMVACVSDFGIAKLLTQAQRTQQTRALGTIGYMAPEYGSEGLISTKVDVYSYGVLLMEMFTRKKPTDEMFTGELTMRKWVSESFPSSMMVVADSELPNMDDESRRCLTSTIGLALECTKDLPEERPNMKDVAAKIRKIKLKLCNHS